VRHIIATGAVLLCMVSFATPQVWAAAPRFEKLAEHRGLAVFQWQDTCNVYVLRDGEAALMIDIGDGSVVAHLGEIGVRRLEWVLLTHHHREQCQGHPQLRTAKPQVAGPEAERALWEHPADFRKLRPSLGDRYTVHGASYVRPLVEPLTIDRGFRNMDVFTWRGHDFWCVETPGNSPGSMSYLLKTDRGWLAFSGDVVLAGARMHNWFDTEWDYGFAKGLYTLIESASLLESFEPSIVLPSHGPAIRKPQADFPAYQRKLRTLAQRFVRGYSISAFAGADQDTVSRPSVIPHLWQTTKHLFKFKGPNSWPNWTVLLADSGRALMVDCGVGEKELDSVLNQMQQRLGLKAVDAVLVTHMHGDHVLGPAALLKKWGAQLWTLDRVAPPIEQPERFDYAAQPWSYAADVKPIKFDRLFKPGEKFTWEGYELTVDWMPGQTEFGCCIHGLIDGGRVAFTGDNLFANAADPLQDGHEAVCARNSAILEEGYIYGSDYLRRLQPDLIIGGHSWAMDRPRELIERYHRWSLAMRDAFREVSAEEDYRSMFDPYWVRVDPYRSRLARGGQGEVAVHVRNFLGRAQPYRIAVHCPAGLAAEPAVLEGSTPAEAAVHVPLRLRARPDAKPGVHIVALDTTVDGRRYGEWFDFIVSVNPDGTGK
jgi:glyoxylase-like metal-dependent hydrolase (beta-lactamase superfamily II)